MRLPLRPFRMNIRLNVTAKFVITFLSILTLSMVVMGIILYEQTTRSAIAQAQVVMEQNVQQMKSSVNQEVAKIENLSQIIAFDHRIRRFLGSEYRNDPFVLQDYRDNVAPILDNLMRQNPDIHSIRIYMQDTSIPELYDGFYQLSRIRDDERYSAFIHSLSRTTMWQGIHPEMAVLSLPGAVHEEKVVSFDRKIFSDKFTDMAGLLEIEVKSDLMFDTLMKQQNSGLGSIMIADKEGQIVSTTGADQGYRQISELKLPPSEAGGQIHTVARVNGVNSIIISEMLEGPELRMIGIFPVKQFSEKVKNTQKSLMLILFGALVVLSIAVYLITSALLSRMKVLAGAMKQVREGSLEVSVPVVSNDEFSLMAQSFNLMTRRIHDLVESVYKSRLLEKEAELRVLESQINPHFLYNTLATISWVARKVKSPEITNLSNSLARFYRLVLNKGKSKILVRDEIEMVRVYLQIQKFRFEDVFDVVFDVDERAFAYHTIKNMLQPLVENALTHGIEPKRDHGTIILKAGLRGEELFFQILDDGVGIAPDRLAALMEGRVENSSGSGYAVHNIRERLRSYYGERHQFEIWSKPGIGTVITITFPRE